MQINSSDNKKFHIRVHILLIPIIKYNICEGYEVYYDYDIKNIIDIPSHITNSNLQKETD